jgi:hypothetical protein
MRESADEYYGIYISEKLPCSSPLLPSSWQFEIVASIGGPNAGVVTRGVVSLCCRQSPGEGTLIDLAN